MKLDQHLDTFRLMEQNLAPTMAGVSCTKPTAPPGPDDDRNVDEQARYTFVNTFIATLFACNMTRVATFHMNSQSMDWASQVSALCDLLKTIDDGNGKTAYDNSIILWTNELGDPVKHLPYNVPFVLAGGGGTYKKGRYLNYGGPPAVQPADNSNSHNNLLVSVLNQFGMNLSSFGDPALTGELADL